MTSEYIQFTFFSHLKFICFELLLHYFFQILKEPLYHEQQKTFLHLSDVIHTLVYIVTFDSLLNNVGVIEDGKVLSQGLFYEACTQGGQVSQVPQQLQNLPTMGQIKSHFLLKFAT